MAISIAFGILFATFIILLIVPALYLAIEDGRRLVEWLGREDAGGRDDRLPAGG